MSFITNQNEPIEDNKSKPNNELVHPNLAATAESIAINILKLESASITAIKQSNILESHVKDQLPTRSKYQQDLPKILREGRSKNLIN